MTIYRVNSLMIEQTFPLADGETGINMALYVAKELSRAGERYHSLNGEDWVLLQSSSKTQNRVRHLLQ